MGQDDTAAMPRQTPARPSTTNTDSRRTGTMTPKRPSCAIYKALIRVATNRGGTKLPMAQTEGLAQRFGIERDEDGLPDAGAERHQEPGGQPPGVVAEESEKGHAVTGTLPIQTKARTTVPNAAHLAHSRCALPKLGGRGVHNHN